MRITSGVIRSFFNHAAVVTVATSLWQLLATRRFARLGVDHSPKPVQRGANRYAPGKAQLGEQAQMSVCDLLMVAIKSVAYTRHVFGIVQHFFCRSTW
jgi:hypothetical protein